MHRRTLTNEYHSNDIFFPILMSMLWADNILMKYVRVGIQKIPFIWKHADMILTMILTLLIFLSLGAMLKNLYMKEILYTIGMYAVFLAYFYLVPDNKMYFYTSGITITRCFPMFLVGICYYRIDREKTLEYMYRISLVTIYVFVFYTVFIAASNERIMRKGDMHGAYNLLPHVCLVLARFIRRPGIFGGITASIGGLMLLFLGNRGSLLCLGVLVIVTILFSGRVKRPWLYLSLAISAMVILFAFGLLDFLYSVAEKYDLSLRIFQKLESGEITYSSGRDKIQERVWEHILKNPIFGKGIFGDRQVAGGMYAHNLIMELMVQYGVLTGLGLFGVICYLLVGTYYYLRKENRIELDLYGALVFAFVFKLFMSSSYLSEPYFFFTLGFACAVIDERSRVLQYLRSETERKGLVRRRRILQ